MTRQNEIERLERFLGLDPGHMVSTGGEWRVWCPFSSLEDAFLVAEKIASVRFRFELHRDGSIYSARFRDIEEPSDVAFWFSSVVASTAIANAALSHLDARENKK